jgi:AraC family transcriptional regulator
LRASTTKDQRARFRKVLEYIDAHLDQSLDLAQLGGVAAFSKYHFHRRFSGLFGITVFKYVRLRRLKRAAQQLAFRADRQIIDIALASGYEGPEAFARAFRKTVGQSPYEFRMQPRWDAWHAAYQPLRALRMSHMKPEIAAQQVRIIEFKDTRVAVLEHRGDPRRIGDSVRSFIAWRKQNHLPPKISATYNILYADPAGVPAADFRLDICAATDQAVAENPFQVVGKTIPGGRCAVLRHTGSDEGLGQAIAWLYSQWLPQSGEELRDFPVYVQRVKFFPDVPETEAVTDVFLPLG